MIHREARLMMLFGVLAGVGCGGDALDCSMVSLQGLDPGQTIVSLSDGQRRQFCDFEACQVGGYGARASCSGGAPVTIAASQNACVAQTPTDPSCTATVQDMLDCIEAVRARPCVSTLFGDPACAAATDIACLTVTANALSVGMAAAISR